MYQYTYIYIYVCTFICRVQDRYIYIYIYMGHIHIRCNVESEYTRQSRIRMYTYTSHLYMREHQDPICPGKDKPKNEQTKKEISIGYLLLGDVIAITVIHRRGCFMRTYSTRICFLILICSLKRWWKRQDSVRRQIMIDYDRLLNPLLNLRI